MAVPSLPAQGSTAWYPWAQGIHAAVAALDNFGLNVKSYGAIGDGSADDGPALQACITAAYVANLSVYLPPGNYKTGQNLTLPQGTPLIGAGSSVTRIFATAQKRLSVTGDSGLWIHPIAGIRFDKVGILAGETTSDYGRGLTLHDLEILNGDVGVEYRNHCWLTRIDNCRIHDMTSAGIYNNFTGVIDSGANMAIHGTAVFNITGPAFKQDGLAADGAHVIFTDSDLEHSTTSVQLRSVGDSVVDIVGGHYELNTVSYIDADSGTVNINGAWMYGEQAGANVAHFVLSGTARCYLNSGRVAWDSTYKLSKITGTAQLQVNPDQIAWARPWGIFLDQSYEGAAYATGSTRGVTLPTGFTVASRRNVGTIAPGGGNISLQRLGAYDDSTYEIDFTASVTSVGATNNNFGIFYNPGGATVGVVTLPNVVGTCQARVVIRYDRARIYWTYSNGTGGMVDTAIAHALSIDKFLELTNGGDSSITFYDWTCRVVANAAT